MDLFSLLQAGKTSIQEAGGLSSDVEWLFARYYGQKSLSGLHSLFHHEILSEEYLDLSVMIDYLSTGCPLEYVLGEAYFDGCWYLVNSHTLIPRPETEEMLFLARSISKYKLMKNILDLGCGSGCLGIGLKKKFRESRVCASDISIDALLVAQDNANRMSCSLEFRNGNWFEPWKDEVFDLIVSNPPYLSLEEWRGVDCSVRNFEPIEALVSGSSGLEAIEHLASQAHLFLVSGGTIILEVGESQAEIAKSYFLSHNWNSVAVYKDMCEKDRFLVANSYVNGVD